VSITPGARALTLIEDGASSFARAFVKPIRAAFEEDRRRDGQRTGAADVIRLYGWFIRRVHHRVSLLNVIKHKEPFSMYM